MHARPAASLPCVYLRHCHVQEEAMQRRVLPCSRFRAAVNHHLIAMRFLGNFRPRSQQDLEKELENVLSWSSFNVNRVSQLSNRQPLLMVGLAALNHFNLLANLTISLESAANFLKAVEHYYMYDECHIRLCSCIVCMTSNTRT